MRYSAASSQGLSVAGMLAAFILKDVISNLSAGVLLVGAQPFGVGDRVCVRSNMMNHEGVVEAIGVRHVVLRQVDGVAILLPNAAMVTSIVRVWPADAVHNGADGEPRAS